MLSGMATIGVVVSRFWAQAVAAIVVPSVELGIGDGSGSEAALRETVVLGDAILFEIKVSRTRWWTLGTCAGLEAP